MCNIHLRLFVVAAFVVVVFLLLSASCRIVDAITISLQRVEHDQTIAHATIGQAKTRESSSAWTNNITLSTCASMYVCRSENILYFDNFSLLYTLLPGCLCIFHARPGNQLLSFLLAHLNRMERPFWTHRGE